MSSSGKIQKLHFFQMTVGKKYLMAVTGIIWAGFVAAHMLGNMLILSGPQLYNAYGHAITSGVIIYFAEAILVVSMLIHVICAISLTRENFAARGDKRYAVKTNGEKGTTVASQTMIFHGSIILVFLITHISTFKYGTYYETNINGLAIRDLHRLIVQVFKQPGYLAWYLIALTFLGVHLSHGVNSLFQSLGLRNDKYAKKIRKISIAYAILVAVGFIIQPLYVYFIAG